MTLVPPLDVLRVDHWRAARRTGRLVAWLAVHWQARSPAELTPEEWSVHVRALPEAAKLREVLPSIPGGVSMVVCNRTALPAPRNRQESLEW